MSGRDLTLHRSNLVQLGREGLQWQGGDSHGLSWCCGRAGDQGLCLEGLSNRERCPLSSSYRRTSHLLCPFESSKDNASVANHWNRQIHPPNQLLSCILPPSFPWGARLAGVPSWAAAETPCTPVFACSQKVVLADAQGGEWVGLGCEQFFCDPLSWKDDATRDQCLNVTHRMYCSAKVPAMVNQRITSTTRSRRHPCGTVDKGLG